MAEDLNSEIKLSELSTQAGVPPRTIRLYISRGLLAGPLRGGRGAVYGKEHLETLHKIRDLQAKGLTLKEIAHVLAGEGPPEGLPEPAAWWSYRLAPDVFVWVRGDVSPWRSRQIRGALARMTAEISPDEEEEGNDGHRR